MDTGWRALRIGRALYERIGPKEGFLGSVCFLHNQGFYLSEQDRRLINFTSESRLHLPFSVSVPQLEGWIRDVGLKDGDRLVKRGQAILKPSEEDVITLSPQEIVDLVPGAALALTAQLPLNDWLCDLASEVSSAGRHDGLAGLLSAVRPTLLEKQSNIVQNPLSLHLAQKVSLLMRSLEACDLVQFMQAWNSITGCGPGLTPSGDDLLTGFLAVHKLLCSGFWKSLCLSKTRSDLRRISLEKTTPIAGEVLSYALDGVFSELLCDIFDAPTATRPGHLSRSSIRDLLRWGHCSGTDTLVGVILALTSFAK